MPRRLAPKSAVVFAACLVAISLLPAAPAAAATKTWIGGSEQWDDSANWASSGQPQAGDTVYLTQTDATDRTVTYYNTTNPSSLLKSLRIDATGVGVMALDMPNPHLLKVTTAYIGYSGKGAIGIRSGAQFTNTQGHLGYNSGSTGTATVTGAGSKWTNSGSLYVGYDGSGKLNIEAGGQVSDSTGYIGCWTGSGTATVTGAGSTWTNSGNLCVGYYGSGTLTVAEGGQVTNTTGFVGFNSGSTGTATVTGAGSTWTNSGSLYVGYSGSGTLTVADGGLVSAATLYAGDLLGNGTITVTQGAVLDADLVFDGTHGTTQTLPFGTGGTLNVTFTSSELLGVGYKGTGTLRIADGVTVTSATGHLGYNSGSTGTATVTGAGSTWTNSGSLYVGYDGSGTLNIEAGGQVSDSTGYIGCWTGSGTATVTGAGSTWTNSGDLYVGEFDSGTLNIQEGGQVSNTTGYIGYYSSSTCTATVTGADSTWTNSGDLYVGYYGNGTLNIKAGGQVSNANGYVGYYSGSTGTATVTGAGSTWTNTGSLYVGGRSSAAGGTGSITVTSGGQLTVGSTLKLWKADSAVTISGGTLIAGAMAGTTGAIRITDPAGGTALTVGSAISDTFSGSIVNDTAPGSLTKVGSGTQTLSGANTFSGDTRIVAGTLRIGNSLALQGSTLDMNAADAGAFDMNGMNATLGGLKGSRNFSIASGKTLTVGANGASTVYSGILSGGGLTKTGDGSLTLSGANTYSGGTSVSQGTLLAANTSGSATGTGPVTMGAATLGGTGFINGPVTLTGDSTLTSTGTLTITSTLTVQGLANQLAAGTVNTSGDVTIEPGAVFIINGTLGGGTGDLIVRGTLMGKGTINKPCVIEAGGVLSPGSPSTIEGMAQMLVGGGPQTLAFEIGAAGPNYASPANSVNDLVRLTDATAPFADATGSAAVFGADTVIDVYFLSSDPALGGYKAEFFAATDFSDAVADATYEYWRLDPRGSRYHNGNLYSPLDESLVDWSVVPEIAMFDGEAASGYITEFTVVPEPATLALVAMGAAGSILRRRRR